MAATSSNSGKQNKLKVSIKARKGNRVEQIIVELEFVQSVPKKLNCVLCQDLLRVPCLVTCCKASYCRDCINRLSITTGKCSIKKCQKNYAIITDGPLVEEIKKKIQSIKVYCFKKTSGCKWSGTIDQLEKSHYNLGEYDERDTSACQYQEVSCPNNCGAILPRGKVKEHRFSECDNETCSCEYCGKKFQNRRLQTEHQKMCLSVPVECPNGCKLPGISRAEIQNHVYEECPLRQVSCDYRHVGCDTEVRFTDVAKHNMESYQKHLDLMSSQLEFVSNENSELRNENIVLHDENRKLYSEINKLVLMLKELGHEIDYVAMDSALAKRANFRLEGSESGYVSCTSHPDRKSLNAVLEDEYVEPEIQQRPGNYQNSVFHADRKSLDALLKQEPDDQESSASQKYLKEMEDLDQMAANNQIYENPDSVRAKQSNLTTADNNEDDDNDDIVSLGLQAANTSASPQLPPKPQNLKRTRSKRSKASNDSQGDDENRSPSRLSRSSTDVSVPNCSSSELGQYRQNDNQIQTQPSMSSSPKHKHTPSIDMSLIFNDTAKDGKPCDAKEGVLIPSLLNTESSSSEQATPAIMEPNEATVTATEAGNGNTDVQVRNPHWGSLLDLILQPSAQEKADEESGYQIIKPRPPRETKKNKQNKWKLIHEEQSTDRKVRSSTYTISIPSSRNPSAAVDNQAPLKVPVITPKFAEAVRPRCTSPVNLPQPDTLMIPDLPPRSNLSKPDVKLSTSDIQDKPDSPPDHPPKKPDDPVKHANSTAPKPGLPTKPKNLKTGANPKLQSSTSRTGIESRVGPKLILLKSLSHQHHTSSQTSTKNLASTSPQTGTKYSANSSSHHPQTGTKIPAISSSHQSLISTKNSAKSPSHHNIPSQTGTKNPANSSSHRNIPSQTGTNSTAKSETETTGQQLLPLPPVSGPPPTAPRPEIRPRLNRSTPSRSRPISSAPISRPRLNTTSASKVLSSSHSDTLPPTTTTSGIPQSSILKRQSLPPADQPLSKIQLIAKQLQQQKLPMNPLQS